MTGPSTAPIVESAPRRRWTGEMALVVDLCGEDAAEALLAVARKCAVYVPLRLTEAAEASPLRQLAPDIAGRILAAMGGATIYVSLPDDGRRAARWARVRDMAADGATAQQIALALQLSERQVYRILRCRARGRVVDSRQIDLFA